MPEITVLIADTQRLFAESLADAIRGRAGFEVVGDHPTNGLSVVEAVMERKPDIVLVDYWMPGMDGPATTRAILAWSPGRKVLHLSWFHGPQHVQQALDAGAVGFLPKSLSVDQVVEGIRRASGGDGLVYGTELMKLMDDIEKRGEHADESWERLLSLTPREVEILQLLSRGLTTKEVAGSLSIASGTVKNHIHSILTKTGARSQLEVIAEARRQRLIWDSSPPTKPHPGPHWHT